MSANGSWLSAMAGHGSTGSLAFTPTSSNNAKWRKTPLGTPWDLSTADKVDNDEETIAGDKWGALLDTSMSATIRDVTYSPDGTSMIVLLYQYENPTWHTFLVQFALTTPYDIATIQTDDGPLSEVELDSDYVPSGIEISPDGTKIYIACYSSGSDYIYRFCNVGGV